MPIYIAAVIAVLVTAYLSDRAKDRSMFVIWPLIVGGIGLVALLAIPKTGYPGVLYAMLFVVAMGLYSIICGTVAWTGTHKSLILLTRLVATTDIWPFLTANNLAGPWKRAVGMALMIALGNLGGVAGSNIFLAREAPHYWTGYGVSLGIVVLSTLTAIFLRWKLKKINAERDSMSVDEIYAQYSEQELSEMGDDSPFFRYTI